MDKQKDLMPKDSYQTVGMHRLIGGFYYNMLAVLLGAIFFIAMFAVILPLIMKYPEIEGYNKIVYGFLGFAFGFFDLGSTRGQDANVAGQLNDGLLRFVGEYEHTDPKRAFKYVQVFVWFQMFTGVIQIALISAIALWWVPFTSVAHLGWFFLTYSLIQFPGCFQIFESIFKGFRQIHLFTIYTFLKDTVMKYGTQISCILIGSAIGRANSATWRGDGCHYRIYFLILDEYDYIVYSRCNFIQGENEELWCFLERSYSLFSLIKKLSLRLFHFP